MAGLRDKITYASLGLASGLGGIYTCQGSACPSCYGCAALGGILIGAALFKKILGKVRSGRVESA